MNQAVKEFWEGRAKRLVENNGDLGMWQSTSLTATETDASQRRDLELGALEEALKVIPNTQGLNLLDIGCGTGRLTIPLSKRFKKVYATDFMQKFLDLAKQNAIEERRSNITFLSSQSHEVGPDWKYHCCTICGVLLCLDDSSYQKTLHTAQRADYVIVKESVGVEERYELQNHFSEALQTQYNAIYRSRTEIIHDFQCAGFNVLMDELVEAHREETNIRIFVFARK